MANPDPNGLSTVLDAVKLVGGAIAGGALTAFAKNFLTTDGRDAREFRAEYREEIKRLREERAQQREEFDELGDDLRALRTALEDAEVKHASEIRDLRQQIERLTLRSNHYLIGRTEARALLNASERLRGIPQTPWPPDPSDGGPL